MKTERENFVKGRKTSDSSEEYNLRHSPSAHELNQPMNRPSSELPSSPPARSWPPSVAHVTAELRPSSSVCLWASRPSQHPCLCPPPFHLPFPTGAKVPPSLPPLPPDANTFQGACVVTPALFSPSLLGSSSGSFLEQYPLAVCLEPLILLGSVCSGQLGWLPTPQNAVFLKQTLVWPCLPPPAQYQCPDPFFFQLPRLRITCSLSYPFMLSLYPPSFCWLLLLSLQRPLLVPKLPLVNISPPLTLESAFSLSSSPPSFQTPQPSLLPHTLISSKVFESDLQIS